MKKSLLFMAFLFILGGLCVNAADVVDAIDNPTKSESYGDKTFVGASETEYLFAQASPQSGFFQIRQSKSSYITNKTTFGKISSISFSLTQGSVKVYGGNTAYTSYTTSPAGVEIETVSSTGNNVVNFADEYDYFYIVPANTTIVKIADIKFTWSIADGPSEPVAYEPNFADVELWEGETVALNLGNKYPTDIIFVSENESVATVSDEGVITAVGAGETTVSVTWDADENFLAPAEPITFNVVVKGLPEGSQFESITGANFADISGGSYASYSVSTDFADYTVITTDANLPNITWNRGNSNVGKDSGIVLKAKDGYYPIWVTVESNWNNDQDMNLYLSNDELTLAGLGTATTAGVITQEASTYVINGEYKYIGIRPSANKSIQLIKLTILWGKAETPDIEFPSFGEAEHSFTTESSEIRIADADHAFDIFYLHTPAPAQDNVEAYAEGDADNFENKAEFDDASGEHVIPVSESGTLSYYAVHTATGTQGATETVKVTKTATTAIDAIGADAAEVEAEYFDIRGVKVNIDNAAPGLYIRRQGTTATKVIVK